MISLTTEPGQGDGQILHAPKSISTKSGSRKINTPSQSKIPKANIASSPKIEKANRTEKTLNKSSKMLEIKKPCKSAMSLGLPKTPKTNLFGSSRSYNNTQRSVTPRSLSARGSEKVQKTSALERVTAKNHIQAFEGITEKLETCQTEFLKKYESVKDILPPIEGEFKLIALARDNDLRLVTKNKQKVNVKCDAKGLEDFSKELQTFAHNNLNTCLSLLEQLKSESGNVGDSRVLSTIEDVKKFKTDNLKALENILKQIDCIGVSNTPTEHSINTELAFKVDILSKEIDEHRKNYEQSRKELSKLKKSEEDKANLYKKELEERNKMLNNKQMEFDELKKQLDVLEKNISKDKSSQKELQEKLNRKTTEADELKKNLKGNAESNLIQQSKNQEYEKTIKKLESDLRAALENQNCMEHSIGDQANKQADKIKVLQEELINAKKEAEKLGTEVQGLRKESEKLSGVNNENLKLTAEMQRIDAENQNLRQAVKDLESRSKASESQLKSFDMVHDELSSLQKSEVERKQKIDVLDMELNKAHFHIKKLEEQICMNQRVLQVRTNLIDSLQSKEETHKIRLQDLFVKVGEKNNDVQMLKTELLTKSEDFENLFSTLSSRQLELTRQEHKIKLLQENNERAQALRVKQEAKIARLEEELAHLKQVILLYQNAVLPNNTLRENLLMVDSGRDSDFNECLGYYVDERRRKRHVDICVKKYEK